MCFISFALEDGRKAGWGDDLHALENVQVEEIRVSRDDVVCLGRYGGFEDPIV
jgi:hypothetical protein